MAFTVGDTLDISGVFVNYLSLAPGVTVQCSSNSPFVQMLDSTASLGDINTLDSANNSSNPFRALILSGAPVNHKVEFTLRINTSSGYQWLEYISLMVNVDYLNIAVNMVSTSITSRGNIGFNSVSSGQGLGFVYNAQNLLFEAGLMIASSPASVSDRVRGAAGGVDADLLSVVNIHPLIPSVVSDFDCEGVFNDSGAVNPIPVKVIQRAFAWDTPGNDKYVRFDYEIVNNGNAPLNGLYAGIFADWDIMNASLNKADTDLQNRLGYCFSSQAQGLYAAIQLLSPQPVNIYGIDLLSGGAGGVNLADGYDAQEKYTSLSTQRVQAGTGGSGNDVAQVVSAGPFNLNPADTMKLAFAVHAGESLSQIQSSAQNALIQYNGSPVGAARAQFFSPVNLYPNPAGDFTILSHQGVVSAELFNSSGTRVKLMMESHQGFSKILTSHLPDGIYFIRFLDKGSVLNGKFAVIHH
jgi:serine protease